MVTRPAECRFGHDARWQIRELIRVAEYVSMTSPIIVIAPNAAGRTSFRRRQ